MRSASSRTRDFALRHLARPRPAQEFVPQVDGLRFVAICAVILYHMQGTDPIEDNLDLVYVYRDLGVRIIQLCYNVKNHVGDGADERTDSGLSNFGVKLVRRLNEAKVIVDCSHTGYRTTMDAIEFSQAPVIVSHGNPKAVQPSKRNIGDDVIKCRTPFALFGP